MTRSLLNFAGASLAPGRPEDSVLLMIDPQREYTTGRLPLAGVDDAVHEGARLLAFAREVGMPVIHVLHHARPGAPLFEPAGEGARFIPPLEPVAGESVLIKHLPNAFAGTDLASRLAAAGRRELVIAGFATHICISATTRSALDHRFRNTIITKTTATHDLPHTSKQNMTQTTIIQKTTLTTLADRFSIMIQDHGALRILPLQ